jgi:hypothetical protein
MHERGGQVGATGLAADPKEYRARLMEQDDGQIDAWASELMRDVAKRRGVLRVLADFRSATRLDDRSLERVYAAGGGAPATFGHDAQGRVIVPAVTLHCLVGGVRHETSDGRERLIAYLVENFGDLVYV